MGDGEYDLVLRDPEGGILQRWTVDECGRPCLGNNVIVMPMALWDTVREVVEEDRCAREEGA